MTTSGDARCWGNDEYGEATPPAGVSFASVSAGAEHTCGVTTSGAAVCWGERFAVRATLPSGPPSLAGRAGGVEPKPSYLSFASVSAGGSHTCGVTTSGAAVCWGERFAVRATLPSGPPSLAGRAGGVEPKPSYLSFASVSAGGSHTCGVTTYMARPRRRPGNPSHPSAPAGATRAG